MTNVEKIKAIIYDYGVITEPGWIDLSNEDVNEIAKRIETEVMGIEDPNEFVNLTDLTKKK